MRRNAYQGIKDGDLVPLVFLSHALSAEYEVTVARLRAIAGVCGLTVRLPMRDSYRRGRLAKETLYDITDADVIILFAAVDPNDHVHLELKAAAKLHKPIIIIAEQSVDLGNLEGIGKVRNTIRYTKAKMLECAGPIRVAVEGIDLRSPFSRLRRGVGKLTSWHKEVNVALRAFITLTLALLALEKAVDAVPGEGIDENDEGP